MLNQVLLMETGGDSSELGNKLELLALPRLLVFLEGLFFRKKS